MQTKSTYLSPGFYICLAGVALLLSGTAQATSFQFQNVAFPTDTFTQLLGVNNAGVIAGYHGAANVMVGGVITNPNVGLIVTPPYGNNSFTIENFPGSMQTQVVGINNVANGLGSYNTGGFYIDSAGLNHGFLYTNGVFQTVDDPAATFNQILGVNDNGEAAGYYQLNNVAMTQQAYTFFGGVFTNVNPPGSVSSQATDVNNAGEVSGFFTDGGGVTHGYLDNAGTFTVLDVPGATSTQALGLNNAGWVVGDFIDAAAVMHGFVYSNGVYQTIDGPNANATTINGVNDNGQIVGFFTDATSNATIGLVGTVPEPGTFVLAGLGALAVGLRQALRKAK